MKKNSQPTTAKPPAMEPLLLRVEEAAPVLRMSRAKCFELVIAGVIPSVKIDGMRRVPVQALRRWIERMTPEYAPEVEEGLRDAFEAARQG